MGAEATRKKTYMKNRKLQAELQRDRGPPCDWAVCRMYWAV